MTRTTLQPLTMRWLLAFLAAIILTAPAFAGVSGRVSSIGFQSFIRNDEWIPIVVQTTSDEPAPHTFDLQVVQTDLDGDEVVYTRPGLTINPGTQTFRTFFRPETINGGLPASGSEAASEFGKRLRVFLHDPATGKRSVRLGVSGAVPQALESSPLPTNIGQKLLLVVGRSPNLSEFDPGRERLLGLAELCYFVRIDPNRLPENTLAYGAVDAVVWTDADAAKLSPLQQSALRQYVQRGGTLVIIQTADLSRVSVFDDLLPVRVSGSQIWNDQEPLKSILSPRDQPLPVDRSGRLVDNWENTTPPYRMADATPTDALSLIDAWTTWPDKHTSPLIARRIYGLGCVAWLAQDISDPSLAGVDFGWPRLWERLLDWRDVDLTFADTLPASALDRAKVKFQIDASRDLSASFLSGLEPAGLSATKLTIAFAFFVVYWLLAGPVSYFVLVAKRRVTMSWFVYGAIAAVAAALTVLIAQVVLRGSPQVKHVSLVRGRSDVPEATRVISRLGIYLPKDTTAAVTVSKTTPGAPASITPFGGDPRNNVTPRDSSYAVAVSGDVEEASVSVGIPFRSTLKKIQLDWTGKVGEGIGGRPKWVDADAPLEGRLSNDTGADLSDVILIFRNADRTRGDLVIAMPDWKNGRTLELGTLWKSAESKLIELPSKRIGLALFGGNKVVRGNWSDAVTWLYEDLRISTLAGAGWNDAPTYGRSFPIASLFGRCPPMTNYANDLSRVDIRRSGLRNWDASNAVAAGALVVLGKANGTLPAPLKVDGEAPAGDGQIFFQAVVPVDRSATQSPDATVNTAATQATTQKDRP
jgi:hypothetical protein